MILLQSQSRFLLQTLLNRVQKWVFLSFVFMYPSKKWFLILPLTYFVLFFFLTGLISVLKKQLNWITFGWSLVMFVTIFWWLPRFFHVSFLSWGFIVFLAYFRSYLCWVFILVLGVNEESKCFAVIRFITNSTSRSCFHGWTSGWSHWSYKGCLWCGCTYSWSSQRWL